MAFLAKALCLLIAGLIVTSCRDQDLEMSKRVSFLKQLHLRLALTAKAPPQTEFGEGDIKELAEMASAENMAKPGGDFLADLKGGKVKVFDASWSDIEGVGSEGPILLWDCEGYSLRFNLDGSIETISSNGRD